MDEQLGTGNKKNFYPLDFSYLSILQSVGSTLFCIFNNESSKPGY